MGSHWLNDLPQVLANADLRVTTYPGWETRSRSSGGYDSVLSIGIHHDASSTKTSNQSAWDWCWKNASDRPIGAIYLGRDGLICVGAAGATNTMGKGGPVTCSRGTVPLDAGNRYMIAIEAANNGVGEQWGTAMLDAYIAMCSALCVAYNLDPSRDIFTHNSYCAPSCPGRKIDPAGPTPAYPTLGGTSGAKPWSHDDFRDLVCDTAPEEEDELTDDDIDRIAQAIWTYKLKDEIGGSMAPAGDHLRLARRDAHNASAGIKKVDEQVD